MNSKRYTIQDIAREAKVGVGTVSRVINNDPNVKTKTREHVQAVIERVGYQPSFTARSLRTQQTHVIGFIADSVATTPYAVDVIKGAQDCAWENEKLLLVVDADGDDTLRERALEMMIERNVEGIIYAAMWHQEVNLTNKFRTLPTVLVDCYLKDASLPSCVPDEVQGGREATRELIKQNHKRIALILNESLDSPYPAARGRYEGYAQALKEAGLKLEPELIYFGDGDAASSFAYTLDLMKLEMPPTAIFCGTDRMAMGTYDALKSLGLSIPKDISVIGFDNQEVIAKQLHPPLSTMALPHAEMGRWAVNYLLSNNSENLQEVLFCPFVSRASIRKLAA